MNTPPPQPRAALARDTDWPRLILRGILAAVVLALLFRFGRGLSDELDALDGWIASLGWAAPVMYALIVALALPLFVPATALKVAAGALFPPLLGVLVYLAGQYASAVIMYVLGRRLLSETVERRLASNPHLAVLRHAAEEGTAGRQFLVRMTPLSFALVCYALSGLGVALRPYLVGCLAAVPSTIATVWFTSAARNVSTLAEEANAGERTRIWTVIVTAAIALAALFALLRWLRPHLMAATESPPREGR